ncbi:LemA family protein [uncultured Methylibium sp.]|uniref:LemA family protein n=1 Tax=uncultured Methylibium sp. TaxID=381093 RepID=UPI0025EF42EE|nr:LemA family protein [uncultured Methylibium sp.]
MSTTRIVVVVLLAVFGFWLVGAYNRLVRLRSAVSAAWTPIDAQLRRRQALAFDLATLLAGPECKGAMDDEVGRATLQSVMAATRQAQAAADHAQVRPSSAGAIQSLGLAEQVLDGALRPLRVLIEARPALVEDAAVGERVHALLQGLQDADAQVVFTRRVFKEAVTDFNRAVGELPTRVVAGLFGFRPAAALQTASPDRGPDSQIASSFGDRP